ncbi:hypothetical protein BDN67DRAFT_983298 [Paxillus ammoniavirescens]|nr:hypothetical protein BDN67DRAFT_983298 [Paxillus ammoniavirescens]
MPPAPWTTKEQSTFLTSWLSDYLIHIQEKDYSRFWPGLNTAWFTQWPEKDVQFLGVEDPLTPEQETLLGVAIEARKTQLQTWFCWRTNGSRRSHIQTKKTSVFDEAFQLKGSRLLSKAELYYLEYYDDHIKPHVKAEQEAGNITTSGALSKELLEAEDEDTKIKIQEMYKLQSKKRRDRGLMEEETDPLTIQEAIEDLPLVLTCIVTLIKQCTRFAVSFLCAGPDPSQNWEIASLFCHLEETPQGNTFACRFPKEENTMLVAFQDYAELLFPVEMCNPTGEHTAAQTLDYSSDVETEHENVRDVDDLEGDSAGKSSGFESRLNVDQALCDVVESEGDVMRDNDREGDGLIGSEDGWNGVGVGVGGLVEGEENVNNSEGASHGNMSLGHQFGSCVAPSLSVPSFDTIGGYMPGTLGTASGTPFPSIFNYSAALGGYYNGAGEGGYNNSTGGFSFSDTIQDAGSFSGGGWNFECIGLDKFSDVPTSNEHSTSQNNQNIPEPRLPAPPLDLHDTTQSAESSTKLLNSKSTSVSDKPCPKPKLVKRKQNASPGAPADEASKIDPSRTVPKMSWAIPPRVAPVQKVPPQAAATTITPKAVDPKKLSPERTTPAASQNGPLPKPLKPARANPKTPPSKTTSATEGAETRVSKRVHVKSKRNDMADTIGANQLMFVNAGEAAMCQEPSRKCAGNNVEGGVMHKKAKAK